MMTKKSKIKNMLEVMSTISCGMNGHEADVGLNFWSIVKKYCGLQQQAKMKYVGHSVQTPKEESQKWINMWPAKGVGQNIL